MASDLNVLTKSAALLLTVIFLSRLSSVNCIPSREFDSMLAIVRARGYTLFSNAVATSDLRIDLLSASANRSFTLLAPPDSSLFALDMTQTASSYTSTLRYHVIPRRLSVSDLHRIPSGTSLPTLLPSGSLRLTRRRLGPRTNAVAVGGVDVAMPELFSGRNLVVHGLAGIITLRSHISFGYGPLASPPARFPAQPSFPPKSDLDSSESHSVNGAIAVPPILRNFGPVHSTNSTNIIPLNRTVLPPAPEPVAVVDVGRSPDNGNGSPFSSPEQSPAIPPNLAPMIQPIGREIEPSAPSPSIAESPSQSSSVRRIAVSPLETEVEECLKVDCLLDDDVGLYHVFGPTAIHR